MEALNTYRARPLSAAGAEELVVRQLAADWIFCRPGGRESGQTAGYLADWLEDLGRGEWMTTVELRRFPSLRAVMEVLRWHGGRVGLKKVSTLIDEWVVETSAALYLDRNAGYVAPEGRFGADDSWYPSSAEEADDVFAYVLPPTAEQPRRYWRRCLTRAHCRRLVEHALVCVEVPTPVETRCALLKDRVRDLLTGRYP